MNVSFHPDILYLTCKSLPIPACQSEGCIHYIAIIGLCNFIQSLPRTKTTMMLLHTIVHLIIYIAHQLVRSNPAFMFHPGQIMKQNLFGITARIANRTFVACGNPFCIAFQSGDCILAVQSHEDQFGVPMLYIRDILPDATVYIINRMIARHAFRFHQPFHFISMNFEKYLIYLVFSKYSLILR